jgi:hypothetical protein
VRPEPAWPAGAARVASARSSVAPVDCRVAVPWASLETRMTRNDGSPARSSSCIGSRRNASGTPIRRRVVRRGTVPSFRLCVPIVKSTAVGPDRQPAVLGCRDELDERRLEQRQPGRATRPGMFD